MTFFDERLPENIEKGSRGGPGFKTTVAPLSSGHEQRNEDWDETRGRWNIGYGILDAADMENVLELFYVARGRARGFRFKDWADFKIGDPDVGPSAKQQIALGDGATTTFQIVRRYEFGAQVFDRNVYKIVSLTDRAFINSTELTRVGGAPAAGQYSIDINAGTITTGDTPGGAASGGDGPSGEDVVYMLAEYDVPVRFDADRLEIASFWVDAHEIPTIILIETRDIA